MSSASRVSDRQNEVYVWTHSEGAQSQPRFEWVNVPTKWDEGLRRELPHVEPGPLFDPAEGSEIGTGFPNFAEKPLFAADRSLESKSPFDIIATYRGLYLLNERARDLFEETDAAGFAFCDVDTRLSSGAPGPRYWLSDLVRKLDVFDVERSEGARVTQVTPYRRFIIGARAKNNVFKRPGVVGTHFFRLLNSPGGIFCDAVGRSAIHRTPKLTGVTCFPVGGFDA